MSRRKRKEPPPDSSDDVLAPVKNGPCLECEQEPCVCDEEADEVQYAVEPKRKNKRERR